jgi:hypothetical protein
MSRSALTFAVLCGLHAHAVASSSVAANQVAQATALELDGTGSATVHIVRVADVVATTNSANGFTLSISSGSLTKAGGQPVAFQVALVDHDATPPSAGAFTTSSGTTYTLITNGAVSTDKDLYIKYRSATLQDPGSYSSGIVLDIADN